MHSTRSIFVATMTLSSIVSWTTTASPTPFISRESNHPENGISVVDIILDQGFWFGDFAVGASKNLSFLVDTGSADVGLNTGEYKPSAQSVNLNTVGQDSYGTTQSSGCGSAVFTENLYLDEVTFGGITANNQTIGSVISSSPAGNVIPHDGIVGFAGQIVSGFNSTPFFHNLCAEGHVKECRFGLALKTNGTGKMVLGEADKNLYKGELSVAPIIEEWFLSGDVAFNGQVIAPNAFIELDSGTANIIGPISVVQQIFNASGVTYEMVNQTGCAPTLVGTYPCAHPPKLGFGFPSTSDAAQSAAIGNNTVSKESTIFDVAAASFSSNNANGICTSVLAGQDIILPQAPNQPLWVVGQPWFQTHYLDFNIGDGTVGVADQSC